MSYWMSGQVLYQPLPPNMTRAYLQEANGYVSLLIAVQYGQPAPSASDLYYTYGKNQNSPCAVFGDRTSSPATGNVIYYSSVQ